MATNVFLGGVKQLNCDLYKIVIVKLRAMEKVLLVKDLTSAKFHLETAKTSS